MKLKANQAIFSIAGAEVTDVAAASANSAMNGSHPIDNARMSSSDLRARVTTQTTKPAASAKLAKRTFTPYVRTAKSLSADARKKTVAQRAALDTDKARRNSVILVFAHGRAPLAGESKRTPFLKHFGRRSRCLYLFKR